MIDAAPGAGHPAASSRDRPAPDSPAAIPARLNLALLGAVSLACAGLLRGASHAPGPWATAACAVLFAAAANTAFALLHEAVHGVFSPRRGVNEWAGRLAAAWFPTGFAMQRAYHLTHHRNNRSRLEQFDLIHDGDVRWLKLAQWYAILTGVYWAMTVAGALAYLVVPRALRARLLAAAGSRAAEQTSAGPYHAALDALDPFAARLEILLSFGLQAALFVLLDLSPGGWLACYAAFGLAWSSLQYADHAFSPLDPRDGAWNLRVGRIARAVFLNYHFHRAHHRNPRVPWSRLPETADRDQPQPTFWRVWRAMWGGPRREPGLDFEGAAAGPLAGPQNEPGAESRG